LPAISTPQRFGVGVEAALLPEEASIGDLGEPRERRPPAELRAAQDRRGQGRWEPRARAYLERRHAEGQARREALRCLKHDLVRVVFRLPRRGKRRAPQLVLKVRGGKVRVPARA
jgi:hypothetical protein